MLWSRREWGQWCAAALAGVGTSGVRAQASTGALNASNRRLVVAVTDKAAFCYLPLTIAERLGYFAAEGVTLEVKEFGDTGAALAAVLGGSAHLLSCSYALTVSQRSRGNYLASFLLQGLAPQIVLGVSHRTMEGYRTLRDLRGRRVGVTGLGSASHRIARLALERASLTERDVRYVALPNHAAALDAFHGGQIDAICYPDPLITRLEQAGELRVLVDTRTARGSQDLFGGPLPAACLAAPPAWFASHPEHCQAAAYAMVRALKWLQTAGPSDINKAVPESYFQGDRALYLAAFERAREAWAPDGLMPQDGPKTVARMLARFGDAPPLPTASLMSTYTNQFALKAKLRFRA